MSSKEACIVGDESNQRAWPSRVGAMRGGSRGCVVGTMVSPGPVRDASDER